MELLQNGDFESGTLSPGWQEVQTSSTSKAVVRSTDSVPQNGGQYALILSEIASVKQLLPYSQTPIFLYGRTYRATEASHLAMHNSMVGRRGDHSVSILYTDGTIDTHDFKASDAWEKFTYKIDANKSVCGIQFASRNDKDPYSSVWLDNVSMEGEWSERKPLFLLLSAAVLAMLLAILAGYLVLS